MHKFLVFLIGVSATAQQIDYKTQLKNKPVVSVSDYSNITNALNAVSAGNNTLLLTAGTRVTLTNTITISQSNLYIQCQPGAGFTAGANITPLTITGNNNTVDGCTIDGRQSQSGYGGNGIGINGSTNTTIKNNTILNVGGVGIFCTNAINTNINYNIVSTTQANSIYCANNVSHVTINNNTVDTTGSLNTGAGNSSIAVYTTTGGANASNILIDSNTILQGNQNFCITVGAFGGNFPTDAITINNYCKNAIATFGTVSYSQVIRGSILNNTLDANNTRIGFAMIELAATTYVTVENNRAINYLALTANGFGGISLDQSSWNIVAFNDIPGPMSLFTGNNSQNPSLISHNKIINNNIDIKAGSTGVDRGAVWLQCSTIHGGSSISYNDFSHNTVNGNSVVPYGFVLENDTAANCTMEWNTFEFNRVDNVTLGMFENFTNSAITNTQTFQNIAGTGVPYTGVNGISTTGVFQDYGQSPNSYPPINIPISQTGFIPYNLSVSAIATTTLTDIAPIQNRFQDVVFNVKANTDYAFEAFIFSVPTVLGGQKFTVVCTCTYWAPQSWWNLSSSVMSTGTIVSSGLAALGTGIGYNGTGGSIANRINGFIQTTSDGILKFQFAQNVANGTSVIIDGSYFRVILN